MLYSRFGSWHYMWLLEAVTQVFNALSISGKRLSCCLLPGRNGFGCPSETTEGEHVIWQIWLDQNIRCIQQ